eukprot:5564477-Pyramimonas_sp.AAC.1
MTMLVLPEVRRTMSRNMPLNGSDTLQAHSTNAQGCCIHASTGSPPSIWIVWHCRRGPKLVACCA